MEFHEFIKSCRCQICERYGSCAVMKDPIMGTLEVCKSCDPDTYDRVAEKQKEGWMSRGKV